MSAKFCKVVENNNTYILADEYGQPLLCPYDKNNQKCGIYDFNKIINDSIEYDILSEQDLVKFTNLSCSINNNGNVISTDNLQNYQYTFLYKENDNLINPTSPEYAQFENQYSLLPLIINNDNESKINGKISKDLIRERISNQLKNFFRVQQKPDQPTQPIEPDQPTQPIEPDQPDQTTEPTEPEQSVKFIETPETQYNNIMNIVTKFKSRPSNLIYDRDISENNLMSFLFSNTFLVDSALKDYFLKYKYTNVYQDIIQKTIFYDMNMNIQKNLFPASSKNIVDLDVSYFNNSIVIKYYFLLDFLSELYGYLAVREKKTDIITIKSRYIIKNNNWVLYNSINNDYSYYIFSIKYEYDINGLSKYYISDVSDVSDVNINKDIITEMLSIFNNDIIKHLNYINKNDILNNNREYLLNIQAFYKFCRLKLIYYNLECFKIIEKSVEDFIYRHLSYCFINLKNNILLKNVDNKSVLLTNKFISVTDSLKDTNTYIHQKNEKFKKNKKINNKYENNNVNKSFYITIIFVSIFLIIATVVYNTNLKHYTNYISDLLVLLFVIIFYISMIYNIKYKSEEFFENINVDVYLKQLYVKHPKIKMTSNTTRDGNYVVKCIASSRQTQWGDVFALFNNNIGDEGGGSYHDTGNYNNGIAKSGWFPNYNGSVIVIDLGIPLILRQTTIYPRPGFIQRMPGIFRIYGTNNISKNNNTNDISNYGNIQFDVWDIVHDQTIKFANGKTMVHTYSQISYSSIWGNENMGKGHARGLIDSPQAWSAIANNQNQWMQISLSENKKISGITTQGRNKISGWPQWVTKFKVSYSTDGTNFTWVHNGAEFTGNYDTDTKVNNVFNTPITARYFRIVPMTWSNHISMRAALIEYDPAIDVINSKPYRFYALAVNQLAGPDVVLNFAEWGLYGIESPIFTTSQISASGITVWEQPNYTGAKSILNVGSYDISRMGIANDTISSVQIPTGYSVTLYEHHPYTGRSLTLTQNEPNLATRGFDNITSGIKIDVTQSQYDSISPVYINNKSEISEYYIAITDPSKIYSLIVTKDIKCDILIVGGGGAGGFDGGGGGGGGQVLYYTDKNVWKSGQSITLNKGTYNIKVGNGGKPLASNVVSENGEDSTIKLNNNIILSAEGGGGGGGKYKAGFNNKKGGGGGYGHTNAGIAENINLNVNNPGINYYIYNGYYNDDISFFSRNNAISSGVVQYIRNIQEGTNNAIINNNSRERYSVQWFGYFLPNVSGIWTFYTNSDDASYLWIGDVAASGFTRDNAIVKNGGLHPMVKRSGTIDLERGKFYPFRIVFGENTGADNINVSWLAPNGSEINNGTGYLFLTNTPLSSRGINKDSGVGGYNSSETGGGGGSGANIYKKNGDNGNNAYGPGNGGIGVAINITGENKEYGGGGAGGTYMNSNRAIGRFGGGSGAIGQNTRPENGKDNTGGGGGGGGYTPPNGLGGYGGSGIIIIKYSFDFNSFIQDIKTNMVSEQTAKLKAAEDLLKDAEKILADKLKLEDENKKKLDDLKKQLDDINIRILTEQISDVDKKIAEKEKQLKELEANTAAENLKISNADAEIARADKEIKRKTVVDEKIKLAEQELQLNLTNLEKINSDIEQLKKNLDDANRNYNKEMYEKQKVITEIELKTKENEAKIAESKIKEAFNNQVVLETQGIYDTIASEMANSDLSVLEAENIAKEAKDRLDLLTSKNNNALNAMIELAKIQFENATVKREQARQKKITDNIRLRAEAKAETALALQKRADELTTQLSRLETGQSETSLAIQFSRDEFVRLSEEIDNDNIETARTLNIKADELKNLQNERKSEIEALNNAISNIRNDLKNINKEIKEFTDRTIENNNRSNEIEKELEQLAIDIVNKTLELQQYKYSINVLDIKSQSNDIGVKIILNINNTGTAIVNNIVLLSLSNEYNDSLEQKDFVKNLEYTSNIDIHIKKRDQKIKMMFINFIMNVFLTAIIILIINNNFTGIYTASMYIFGILFIIFLIYFIKDFIQIVKTESSKKYWAKPNDDNNRL